MTRVLMVSSLWPPVAIGGAEIYAARLACELRRRGHDVAALTLGVDGDDVVASVSPWPYRLDTWAAQPAWKRALFHLADVHRPATARAIAAAVHRFEPDVVHSHAVQGLSTTALTAPAGSGPAHVHTLHDYWLLCQRTTMRRRSGRPCRRCSACGAIASWRRLALRRHGPDVLVAPSAAVARHHRHIARRTPIEIVRHPWDRRSSRPRPPRSRASTFGYLGQLTDVKGVRTLLAAFDRLPAIVDAQLLVAGVGPLSPLVAERASRRVHALGWVDGPAKERFFDAIDCLVVPSEWDEPAGLVVLEAATRGVPVIAAAAGGIPDYLPPSCRSLLFTPGDAAGLAASMVQLTNTVPSPPTLDHVPDWSQHVDRLLAVYELARVRARAGRRP